VKRFAGATLFILLAAFSVHAAQQPTAEQIEAWAKQLADDDFSTRAAAEDSLREAGDAAQAVLEKTLNSTDAEARARANRVLKTLKTEPILKKMIAATTEAKFVEADMEMKMKMMNSDALTKGHFKSSGDGKKLVLDMVMGMAGQAMPMHIVGDGTTFWSELSNPSTRKKMVQKFSAASMEKMGGGSQNPLQGVKELRDRFNFTDLKDSKIGETEVYVLEGRLKEGVVEQQTKIAREAGGERAAQMAKQQLEMMDRSRIYVDKTTYLVRRTEVLDPQEDVLIRVDLTNIKLNVALDENDFKYTLPDGVKVVDMDEQMKAARGGDK